MSCGGGERKDGICRQTERGVSDNSLIPSKELHPSNQDSDLSPSFERNRRTLGLNRACGTNSMNGKAHFVSNSALKPFFSRTDERSTEQGHVLWGMCVIIPPAYRETLFDDLHEVHPGMSRMKSLAPSYIWWPSLDEVINSKIPINGGAEKQQNTWCCLRMCGNATVTMDVPRRGFVPGESIPISANVVNNTPTTLYTTVDLVQYTCFYASGHTKKFKRTICYLDLGHTGIRPRTTHAYTREKLRIPTIPPSGLVGCDLIDIQYILKLIVSSGILFGYTLRDRIIVGTVPLQPDSQKKPLILPTLCLDFEVLGTPPPMLETDMEHFEAILASPERDIEHLILWQPKASLETDMELTSDPTPSTKVPEPKVTVDTESHSTSGIDRPDPKTGMLKSTSKLNREMEPSFTMVDIHTGISESTSAIQDMRTTELEHISSLER